MKCTSVQLILSQLVWKGRKYCFQSRGIVFYMYLFIVFTSYIYSLAPTQKVKAVTIYASW